MSPYLGSILFPSKYILMIMPHTTIDFTSSPDDELSVIEVERRTQVFMYAIVNCKSPLLLLVSREEGIHIVNNFILLERRYAPKKINMFERITKVPQFPTL